MRNGKIIKPNQVFEAALSEIPAGFRDVIVPIGELPPNPEDIPIEVPTSKYQLQSRGAGWYDVIDATGKTVNENAMRQAEARVLLERLVG